MKSAQLVKARALTMIFIVKVAYERARVIEAMKNIVKEAGREPNWLKREL
ncbi:hypothetical protein AB4Z22_15375 [Paenibacillus sp. TAF58]